MKVDFKPAWAEHDRLAQKVPKAVLAGLGGSFTPRALALRLAHETLSKYPRTHPPSVIDPACGLGSLMLAALEWASSQRPEWLQPWLTGRLMGWEVARELMDGTARVMMTAGKCVRIPAKPKLQLRDSLECD